MARGNPNIIEYWDGLKDLARTERGRIHRLFEDKYSYMFGYILSDLRIKSVGSWQRRFLNQYWNIAVQEISDPWVIAWRDVGKSEIATGSGRDVWEHLVEETIRATIHGSLNNEDRIIHLFKAWWNEQEDYDNSPFDLDKWFWGEGS